PSKPLPRGCKQGVPSTVAHIVFLSNTCCGSVETGVGVAFATSGRRIFRARRYTIDGRIIYSYSTRFRLFQKAVLSLGRLHRVQPTFTIVGTLPQSLTPSLSARPF